jgi:hypothetical protein
MHIQISIFTIGKGKGRVVELSATGEEMEVEEEEGGGEVRNEFIGVLMDL